MKQLINGKIPAGSPCPFRSGCGYALTEQCSHDGKTEFSCGTARAFDLMASNRQDRLVESANRVLESIDVASPQVQNLCMCRHGNHASHDKGCPWNTLQASKRIIQVLIEEVTA